MNFISNSRKLEVSHILDQHELSEIRRAVFNVDSKISFNHNLSYDFKDEICELAATISSSRISFMYFVQKCLTLRLPGAATSILTRNIKKLKYLSVALTSCCLGSVNILNAAYNIDVLCIVYCLPSFPSPEPPLSPNVLGLIMGQSPIIQKTNPGEVIMRPES
jgi:hypothetical protein